MGEDLRAVSSSDRPKCGNRSIDGEAKSITRELVALEQPIDDQIKTEEARKAEVRRAKEEARLKAEGVLGGYGIGVNDVQSCVDTLAATDIDVILLAGRYTLADQSGVVALAECLRRKIAVVAGGPFNSGILASSDWHGAH